jgi:aarF domain-containing kinase
MCAALGFPVNTVAMSTGYFHADPHPGNLLATRAGDLVYLDFGMMSEAPLSARYGIMAHVVHLVNREYGAMARDYYTLGFLQPVSCALSEVF